MPPIQHLVGYVRRTATRVRDVVAYTSYAATGFPSSLTTIANYHASDKGTLHGRNPWPLPGHNYTSIYETYFSPLREEPVHLLEIGIGVDGPGALGTTVFGRNPGGASLKMWRDYFPHGRVYGIDLNEATFVECERITTFIGDQGSRDSLSRIAKEIGRQFDIIIDDGSHASVHQQITLGTLFPHLKPGGLFVIEDLAYQPPAIERPGGPKTTDLLRRFLETGRFESPHLTAGECDFLTHHTRTCSLHSPRGNGVELAFLTRMAHSSRPPNR
jgi:hypothetical protein